MQNPFCHIAENHRIQNHNTRVMNKDGAGFQRCSWLISKSKFYRSINQINKIELLCKIKVLLANYLIKKMVKCKVIFNERFF